MKGCPVRLPTFLVEDNTLIRDNLISAMEQLVDATFVGSAAGETEAKAWLQANEQRWFLAIVDLFLEEGTGLGVVASCQNRRPDQRVVILTNYATAAIARRALNLGADAVFDKSTELDAFLEFCLQHRASLST